VRSIGIQHLYASSSGNAVVLLDSEPLIAFIEAVEAAVVRQRRADRCRALIRVALLSLIAAISDAHQGSADAICLS
jgi:hypothetical protein